MASSKLNFELHLLLFMLIEMSNGQMASKNDCQKEGFFANAGQLQGMASKLIKEGEASAEAEPAENEDFLKKTFDFLCCIMETKTKNYEGKTKTDKNNANLQMPKEIEANHRNFCHQLKRGKSIWEAAKSAENTIIASVSKWEWSPQIYEQTLRKMTTLKILDAKNQTKIGRFEGLFVGFLNKFWELIKDKRMAPTVLGTTRDGTALSAQSDQAPRSGERGHQQQKGIKRTLRPKRHNNNKNKNNNNNNNNNFKSFFSTRKNFDLEKCALYYVLSFYACTGGVWLLVQYAISSRNAVAAHRQSVLTLAEGAELVLGAISLFLSIVTLIIAYFRCHYYH